MSIMSVLPRPVRKSLRRLKRFGLSIPYRGQARLCPVCGKSSSRFASYGVDRREDAQCVRCGALERHRLTWLFFQRRTDLFDGANKKVLHVAPELVFETLLSKQLGDGYLTADLSSPDAAIQMDITDICYPDESFDVIYCSHVLEHVPDDRKAMGELFRVLKPHGWAVLLAPIGGGGEDGGRSVDHRSERASTFVWPT